MSLLFNRRLGGCCKCAPFPSRSPLFTIPPVQPLSPVSPPPVIGFIPRLIGGIVLASLFLIINFFIFFPVLIIAFVILLIALMILALR
ncbi:MULTISPECIES: hypothetical protein [unclassified Dehalobacter]|uniref:hypothetical protein n=1 Tax=unclassified Dehalobacter TaxID=2635733 RepID=UPI000ECB2D4F|nr:MULTISPECIES: hypothetical protein [unclassified Dehalobacter]RJE48836.1 hypothetical protein A7K50_08800 [Dehalobacter sp. MCB1]